jgi:hypothetical protein
VSKVKPTREAGIAQRDPVDITENHHASESEFIEGALHLGCGSVGCIHGKRRQRCETITPLAHDISQCVIHQARQFHGALRRFDVRAGRGEAQDLLVHSRSAQDVRAVSDVPVSGNENVVVPRVMHERVSVGVESNLDIARTGLDLLEILGRVEVVMKINDGHLPDPFLGLVVTG